MRYKEMIEEAKAKGLTSEKEMWQGIALIDELLCEIKEEHPDLYWAVIRDQFGIFNKGHYNEEFARYDVSEMQPVGEYWSCKDVEEATKTMVFPSGVNKWDKYVAFNGMANDLQGEEDAIILKVAYKFYFADKDWHKGNKIWEYMKLNSER
jgi:RES domain-containing protein